MSQLPNNATIAEVIASLQESEGIGQKAELASVLAGKGVTLTGAESVAELVSKVDGGWGVDNYNDWGAYTPQYSFLFVNASVVAGGSHTFINVAGEGFFRWCKATSSLTTGKIPDIRFTVDGVIRTFAFLGTGSSYNAGEVDQIIPFKQSLKIELLNTDAGTKALFLDYLYFIKSGTPDHDISTLMNQSQHFITRGSTSSATLTDVVNVTGSGYFLSAMFLAYQVSTNENSYAEITIDGVVVMPERSLFQASGQVPKMPHFQGPIRFNQSLRIRVRVNAGGVAIPVLSYSLD